MRRTEAKEALQALHYRLLYAVRTEPRPKKNVFGGRDGDEWRIEEKQKDFMQSYLAKRKQKKALQELNGNVNGVVSSRASKLESEVLIRGQVDLSQ